MGALEAPGERMTIHSAATDALMDALMGAATDALMGAATDALMDVAADALTDSLTNVAPGVDASMPACVHRMAG